MMINNLLVRSNHKGGFPRVSLEFGEFCFIHNYLDLFKEIKGTYVAI